MITRRQAGQNWWLTGLIALVTLIIGGLSGTACGSSGQVATSSPQPSVTTPVSSPSPKIQQSAPVTIQAGGATKTAPFDLSGGNYAITYDFSGNCAYFASLKSPDGTYSNLDLASGSGPVKGTTHLYGLKRGSYYIDFNTGPPPDCPWSLTFTPA